MFRNEIRTEIEIEGTAQEVWETLTDFESYSEWNTASCELTGRAEVGELHITFRRRPGARRTCIRPSSRRIRDTNCGGSVDC